jgi:prepilin-type N-terminal cleavage/methylation domain-containing protein
LREMTKMRRLGKGQRGFTLVELVIVVALAGIVSIAITATLFQIFSFSTLASNQMTAIRQVQQAGFWVSPDVMMADPGEIDVNPGGGKFVTLSWTAHDGTVNEVDYILQNIPSTGVARLMREHDTYVNSVLDSTTMTTVAEYIDPAGTSFVADGDGFRLTVTATLGEQTETRTYEVKPRVGT